MLLKHKKERITDRKLEEIIGVSQVETIMESSLQLNKPVPILGLNGIYAYKGIFITNSFFEDKVFSMTGFASLSDLITEATTGGKRQEIVFRKVGTTGVAGSANTLWNVGNVPAAGGVHGAAPGGTVTTSSTTGAIVGWSNPGGSDTLHLVQGQVLSSVANNTLLLFDRLWGASQSLNATNTAYTGVPTRYTGTSAAGNFVAMEVTTAMSATATNLIVTYVDQDGNAAQAGTTTALTVSSAVNRVPFPTNNWFYVLASPDVGTRNITNIQSTGANTGVANFFIGRPLAYLPLPVANVYFSYNFINEMFNLVEVKSSACLSLMELNKAATTATTYNGSFTMVSG